MGFVEFPLKQTLCLHSDQQDTNKCPCLVAFLSCPCWHIAAYLGMLLPLVDYWNNVTQMVR